MLMPTEFSFSREFLILVEKNSVDLALAEHGAMNRLAVSTFERHTQGTICSVSIDQHALSMTSKHKKSLPSSLPLPRSFNAPISSDFGARIM
jgi:hypothetical protein